MYLDNLGANKQLRQLIQAYATQGMELGRICFAAHEQYAVYLESGEYAATPTGRLRWDDALPAVGDWVAARRVDQSFALIEEVLPRRTQFSRTAAGTARREQVIAANIDLAMIVCGLDHDFNMRRIERYLVLAQESGAAALIVLNKADLCSHPEEQIVAVQGIAPGIPVVAISACETVDSLKPFTKDKTVALLGSSGAGKSTIANALLGEWRQETSEVRAQDSRGRHTTTHRMLLRLPDGGVLIDNPGMREVQLWASESALDDVFSDITLLAESCRFADCTHNGEPSCAVQAALEDGELDSARWHSFTKLQAELRHLHRMRDAGAMAAQKKQWKVLHKALRHHPKYNR